MYLGRQVWCSLWMPSNTLRELPLDSHHIRNHLLHLMAHSVLVKGAALEVGYSQLGRGRQFPQRRELHQSRMAVEPRQVLKDKLPGMQIIQIYRAAIFIHSVTLHVAYTPHFLCARHYFSSFRCCKQTPFSLVAIRNKGGVVSHGVHIYACEGASLHY